MRQTSAIIVSSHLTIASLLVLGVAHPREKIPCPEAMMGSDVAAALPPRDSDRSILSGPRGYFFDGWICFVDGRGRWSSRTRWKVRSVGLGVAGGAHLNLSVNGSKGHGP